MCTQPDCWLCELYDIDDGMTYAKMKLLNVDLGYEVDRRITIFLWYDGAGKIHSDRIARPVPQPWLDELLIRIADSKAEWLEKP